jgi:hypothetical protein
MDNSEHSQLWAHDIEGAIKNGQSRSLFTLDTRDCRSNQECSELSILDCSFNLVCLKLRVLWIVHSWLSLRFSLTFIFQLLWIVHSWLLLQSRVPNVDSALDCPFLIVVPSVFSNVYLSVSLDCPFLIAPSISCGQGWQCSGLSILDCSFNLVSPKLAVLYRRDDNQEWTIQSTVNFGSTRLKEQSRMDNPEELKNKR